MSTELAILDDRYRLDERLGAGLQGETFAALDRVTNERVALKLLHADAGADPHAAERLLAEYRHLATVRHAHLLRVFAVGRVATGVFAGRVYFTSELLTTHDLVSSRDPARALPEVTRAVAGALLQLHREGLWHRDVKPENLGRSKDGAIRLFDLGLVATALDAAAVGSLPYAAPELFVGGGDARADLYSLGATILGLALGRAPLLAGRPLWLATDADRVAFVRTTLADAATGFVNLVVTLVARDPEARPRSADEVVAALDRLAGVATPPLRQVQRPPLMGREGALQALTAALDRQHGSEVVLRGPPGAGVQRVASELVLRLSIAALTEGQRLTLLDAAELTTATPHETLDATALDRQRRRAMGAAWQTVRRPNVLLRFDEESPSDLVDLARRGGFRPACCLFIETHASKHAPEAVPVVALTPLTDSDAAALVARMRPFDRAATTAIVEHAGAWPGRIVMLVRALDRWLGDRLGTSAVVEDWLAARATQRIGEDDLDALETALVLIVGSGEQHLAIEQAARLMAAPVDAVRARVADLVARGWLTIERGTVRLADASRFAAWAWADVAAHRSVAAAVLARATDEDSTIRRAELALLAGQVEVAASLLADPPLLVPLQRHWRRLATVLLARRDAPPVRHRLAVALVLRSRYAEALALLDDAPRPTAPMRRLAAEILLRLGEPAAAIDRLADLSDEAADALRARACLQRGDWVGAQTAAAEARTSPLAIETSALAAMYLHDYAKAATALERLLLVVTTDAERARTRSLFGMLAHLRGELAVAEQHFAAALELAAGDADLHAEAVYTTNLAAARREQAHYGEALAPTARSLELLGSFGRPGELAIALVNAGNLELSLGDLDAARRYVDRATELARARDDARCLGLAENLRGDLEQRRGALDAAAACYRRALEPLTAPGDRLVVTANLVDIAARADDAAALATVGAELSLCVAESAAERLRLARAHAVFALHTAHTSPATLAALQPPLTAAIEAVTREGRRHDALRGEVMLARLALAVGDRAATQHALRSATQTWEQIVSHIPPSRLAEAATDPDVEKLQRLNQVTASPSAPPSAPLLEGNAVERLLEVVKRLNSELRLDLLLEFILDAAIELVRAERGFLLLDDGAGTLAIATARNLDRDDLQSGPAEFSRSIAERAARNREVIVSLDAVEDRRFESSRSVAALHVRSVVAVPLESRSRLLGCIYLDHRLRARAFADRDVAVIRGLADHAAVAIENARLHDEERKQRQEVGRLNAELADRVSVQAEELTALRREVRQGRAALELRYNYDKLVGRSPAMLELFRLLDRVTDTTLPVVIYGESGTGKELVARAIHHNGARAQRSFVSESCAAIPDTLLESILFGHTRGSFTGADSDRRGLFEVASGGTLFLDEVGEMSPSMQAKLLRVLQQGELRRVGSEKVIKVDVRVVVASNRDLSQLVASGAFREDLFYRLNVVRVALPSLRQRTEDIPLLVEHFLRKIGETHGQPPRRVARAALDRLITYRWPGNVRELENEMLRAAALGGDLISVADLSPHIAAGSVAGDVSASATFDLKERVERLERALVREALDRAGGNQSKAAALLGLSRFGLTKKMKRYRMST